jgi:glucokinase
MKEQMFIGIEIGGTKVQVVAGDAAGAIAARARFSVDRARGAAGIRAQILDGVAQMRAGRGIGAVGVGFGGPVDWRTGVITCSHHIAGWDGFALRAWLQRVMGVPVAVENDANTAALAEARCGAGRGCDPVFYVTLGSGVGGGLVADGVLYHGAPPSETEIGHMRLDRRGTIVEQRCAGWAMDRRIRAASRRHPHSALARLTRGMRGGEARALAAALRARDAVARALLDAWADDLALGLSHVVQLLHPALIVLGGGLALVGAPLRAAVARALPRYVMKALLPAPRIALAALGEDVVPVGALLLATGAYSQAQARRGQ